MTSASHRIILHISGPDRPGITSTLAEVLDREGARLIDIGQSVLHGYLTLSAIVDIPQASDALRQLLFAVSDRGLRLEVSALNLENGQSPEEPLSSLCLTLLGALSSGHAVAETTRFLAERKMNIRDIRTLTEGELEGLELTVDLPGQATAQRLQEVRGEILQLAQRLQVDIAVQEDNIFRRHRRLLCMDVDSTFLSIEVIDELARLAGCYEKVAAITERAMRGELDFKTALRERVALLRGLPVARARELLDRVPLTPGAAELVATLKQLGFQVGLVSGGFEFLVQDLKKRFHLDFAFANQLEVEGDKLSGRVSGTIVDAERKAQILRDMTQVFHCRLEQSIAVGDGANDILMLQSAGLGIAFRAKPRLQEVADLSLNQGRLDSLLMLMGFHAREIRKTLRGL